MSQLKKESYHNILFMNCEHRLICFHSLLVSATNITLMKQTDLNKNEKPESKRGHCMNNPNGTPKTRYEKKRKQKLVSFNTENLHDADLLTHVIKLNGFSGWVKEKLNEDMMQKKSSQ